MATTETSTVITELSNGNPNGTRLGQGTSDLVAFYGGTPTAQQSLSSIASAATIATAVASIQEIIDALQANGLMG